MSGGSYDCVYSRSVGELFNDESGLENLREMVKDFREEFTNEIRTTLRAATLASDIDELIRTVELCSKQVDKSLQRLSPILKSFEWYRSQDTGVKDFKEDLKEWFLRSKVNLVLDPS